ncbi:TPA: ABC transporter substrate-binding protein [Klebsiella pneumoniae]|nr:ABC transporter substrate-binding protein [Klebsiella pneumoniae]HCB0110740.1 ABC transporter substrate-binding protein [Klebsiella pneumoniae]HED9387625.1 ABC transporter substrate-binding protein [Klebsiella pneumoniae]
MSHNKPSRLRFAINLGNAVLAHLGETGKPAGITVELSHRLATRWGVSAEFVPYPAAGKVVADAGGEHWDIAFLAIDPAREATLRFTSPYITIQGTALVSVDSPCQSVADMDRPATTINVGQNAAYDLWLTRHLQHASLHHLPSSQEAIDAFLAGEGDMVAGIRQPLEATARQHAGVRVLADNFTEIQQAICVARADVDRFHAVNDALSEWRADGSLQALIAGHLGQAN